MTPRIGYSKEPIFYYEYLREAAEATIRKISAIVQWTDLKQKFLLRCFMFTLGCSDKGNPCMVAKFDSKTCF